MRAPPRPLRLRPFLRVSSLVLHFWRILYRLLLLFARPWVHARLWWRGRKEPRYRERVPERFARLPPELPAGVIWFHTVSAGETIAAAPLIRSLVEEFPGTPFLVTTMTPTGSAQVSRLLGDRVAHCYAPYDFPGTVSRFYRRVRPRLLVLMETELWPNTLREAGRRGVPVLLVNARLSHRSAGGYRRLGALTREMLGSLRFVACQYPEHAERFVALGAPPERVGALGSVKFDVQLPEDHGRRVAELSGTWGLAGRPVWIAGSTHPGEEDVVLAAHRLLRARFPDAVLILVPRHPERCREVSGLIRAGGWRQDALSAPGATPGVDVILGDTMGDLLYLYGLSRVAFLGGSLVASGGHNPIEAAVCRQPLVMGTSTFNFPDVVSKFSDAGCLHLVRNAGELADVVAGYLSDRERCREAGEAAANVVAANAGATARLVTLLGAEIRAAKVRGPGGG